jgi:hypothetical protein
MFLEQAVNIFIHVIIICETFWKIAPVCNIHILSQNLKMVFEERLLVFEDRISILCQGMFSQSVGSA